MAINENDLPQEPDTIQPENNIHSQEAPKTPLTTEAEIKALLNEAQTGDKASIQKIVITKEIFKKIKDALHDTIASMEQNPSYLSRASKFWGQFALWKKILIGIAITIPTLTLGIVFHLWFLLAICGVTAIIYTGATILFHNHQKCQTNATEHLEQGVFGLADLLELTITALDSIREQLAAEVNKFSEENMTLQKSSEAFKEQNKQLAIELDATATLVCELQLIKNNLESTSSELEIETTKLTALLTASEKAQEQTMQAYKEAVIKLEEQSIVLANKQAQLQESLEEAGKLTTVLGEVTAGMSSLVINNEGERARFNESMQQLLQNKESTAEIFTSICQTKKQLEVTQKLLAANNTHYESLLETHRSQIEELQTILKQLPTTQSPPPYAPLLATLGMYGGTPPNHQQSSSATQLQPH